VHKLLAGACHANWLMLARPGMGPQYPPTTDNEMHQNGEYQGIFLYILGD